jgi:hypothetical protein
MRMVRIAKLDLRQHLILSLLPHHLLHLHLLHLRLLNQDAKMTKIGAKTTRFSTLLWTAKPYPAVA